MLGSPCVSESTRVALVGTRGLLTVYVGSQDRSLYAINPDGTLKWTLPVGEKGLSSPVLGADGTIYVGSFDNSLYAIGEAL